MQSDFHLPYLAKHLRLIVILVIILYSLTVAAEVLFGIWYMVSRSPVVYTGLPVFLTDTNIYSVTLSDVFLSICLSREGGWGQKTGRQTSN